MSMEKWIGATQKLPFSKHDNILRQLKREQHELDTAKENIATLLAELDSPFQLPEDVVVRENCCFVQETRVCNCCFGCFEFGDADTHYKFGEDQDMCKNCFELWNAK